MDVNDVRAMRLRNQLVTRPMRDATPAQVVSSMGALQSQVYAMAKWAIGLRLMDSTESEIEAAFQSGEILRTHVLRPTWHFVAPSDIRWMLKLTASHVHRRNGTMYRRTELDDQTLLASSRIIEKALSQGDPLTRTQLAEILEREGITASGVRLSCIMMYAELEGVICSGPRNGKQFTYDLMDNRAPATGDQPSREESIHMLAERYFTSRGPATVRDFATWSGLSISDARVGAASLDDTYESATIGNDEYFFSASSMQNVRDTPNSLSTFLMPDYDEYIMGYKDRTVLAPVKEPDEQPSEYSHWLVIRGRVEGTWQPPKRPTDPPTIVPYSPLNAPPEDLTRAQERYQRFFTPRV